nr:MAG TPA: hypothetical protein [Caudoviricetes sp.]DAW54117.1 MAG TPA: hypothetical protein [Caudoviricetes sp.]
MSPLSYPILRAKSAFEPCLYFPLSFFGIRERMRLSTISKIEPPKLCVL